jgi:hypothetical protein
MHARIDAAMHAWQTASCYGGQSRGCIWYFIGAEQERTPVNTGSMAGNGAAAALDARPLGGDHAGMILGTPEYSVILLLFLKIPVRLK